MEPSSDAPFDSACVRWSLLLNAQAQRLMLRCVQKLVHPTNGSAQHASIPFVVVFDVDSANILPSWMYTSEHSSLVHLGAETALSCCDVNWQEMDRWLSSSLDKFQKEQGGARENLPHLKLARLPGLVLQNHQGVALRSEATCNP